MQCGDYKRVQELTYVLELLSTRWSACVSKMATRDLCEKKFNKPMMLPLTTDISLLNNYLNEKEEKLRKKVQNDTLIKEVWVSYAMVVLVQIILFNRRRSGETSKMTLDSLTESRYTSEMVDMLSPLEKEVLKSLKRFEVRGKRGRKVPILLTARMERALLLLSTRREAAGVSSNNQFLFASNRKGAKQYIRGSDALRKLSEDCGATQPALLRSTRLRKHIATVSQLVNMDQGELEHLATFLGHDITVHRKFYRLPEATVQTAKISKLLLALEKYGIDKIRGKTLDDIEVELPS